MTSIFGDPGLLQRSKEMDEQKKNKGSVAVPEST